MDKVIVFKNAEGGCSLIIPSNAWKGTLDELAKKDVPDGSEWRVCDVSDIPSSRNWRNAWTDDNPTDTVDIDLDKAKDIHRGLIVRVSMGRIKANEFGDKDFRLIKKEIGRLKIDGANSLEELYNIWPDSTNLRLGRRKYTTHDRSK